jgi:hypothetical protein
MAPVTNPDTLMYVKFQLALLYPAPLPCTRYQIPLTHGDASRLASILPTLSFEENIMAKRDIPMISMPLLEEPGKLAVQNS